MCSYAKIHEWQTRLALIKPNEDRLACLELSLVVVDLVDLNTGAVVNHNEIVTYDALSYAWGTLPPSIECICDGNMILLRENLASALEYLRLPQDGRYIWIDFLCINQDDLDEKAVQIPRMKNIYSKASTVIIWLGKSLVIADVLRECQQKCGLKANILACSNHRVAAWKSIMEYTWFRRTWVRQEVFAAERLNICSPYFSTMWEHFNESLRTMSTLHTNFGHETVHNLTSLNELYSSRKLQLLDLLKQGKGFQASVPHDHIFSVLGMMSTPKHSTKGSFPVTYEKTYNEICGDVTRFIIRESRSISILKLCTVQRDRSYAFSWPTVEMFCPISGEMILPDDDNTASESIEWFEKENTISEVSATMSSASTVFHSIPGKSMSRRPLVLYGRAWGTLVCQLDNAILFDSHRGKKSVSAYLVDHETDGDIGNRSFSQEGVDGYCDSIIYKRGLIRCVVKGVTYECESRVRWECRGSVREGDIFASLEPGPWNILLRKCSGSEDMLEVVGWASSMKTTTSSRSFKPIQDKTAYYLADGYIDSGRWEIESENHPPGPKQRFKIR